MTGFFREVVGEERLVFTTNAFADESGNLQLEGVNTVTFEEHEGKTTLTVVPWVKLAPALAFAADGMEIGWSQSLERLGELFKQA